MHEFYLDDAGRTLRDGGGRVFDPARRGWVAPARGRLPKPEPLGPKRALGLPDAVRWLQKASGHPVLAPVSVIGGREAEAETLALAERVGGDLAAAGLTLLTGGKGGVMEAACRGAKAAGGIAIGLLPDTHWSGANPHVTVALASGIGIARNALIARAGFAAIAIGGGLGTMSEMAFAVQFGRPVYALPGAPEVPGAERAASWEKARDGLFAHLLALGPERLDDGAAAVPNGST